MPSMSKKLNRDGVLNMKLSSAISACLERCDSFYLYDERVLMASVAQLRKRFPQIDFLYSIKCNSNANVLRSVFALGLGADAASAGEVNLAHEAGLPAAAIYYSAPGKSAEEIMRTIGRANLIADSTDEIIRIQTIAERTEKTVNVGLRINPDFSFSGDGGRPSKFGIDEDQALSFLQTNRCKNVKVTGIHVHLRSQERSADVLAAYYGRMFRLADRFERLCGSLEYVNMGSGMGIPYAPEDAPLDIAALGSAVQKELDRYRTAHPYTKIIIEAGRYAVCKSGVYVMKVLDRKVSYGKTYLILKNTLNGFFRPSLAQLISQYSAETSPVGAEPLFTSKNAFRFLTLKDDAPSEIVTLAGNLCTNTDVIAEDISLPHLECGDAVIVTNAGSYAAVLSPMQFSSQDKPKEFFLKQTGEIV